MLEFRYGEDMVVDARPGIEPYFWDIKDLKWPVKGKTRKNMLTALWPNNEDLSCLS
jgi:hypothetical protein